MDDGTARTAGEAWTINGGVLTIRTDTRVHANSPASNTGSLGATTISSSLGGGILIDGRNVREVWFNSGSGTVPAIGTTISQGVISGYLLGVWANLNSLPSAVGAAMPATGFIKFREVTGGNFAAGVLTGITASATGADTSSWIEIVQRQSVANTVPRLGYFRTRGTWYYLQETTSGSANQTIQTPSMGSANTHIPGVWVETNVGTNVYEFYPAVVSTYFLAANLGTDARCKFVRTIGNGQVVIGHDGTTNAGYVPPAGCKIRIPNVIGHQCASGTDAVNTVPHATQPTRPDFTTTSAGVIDFEYFINDWYHYFVSPSSVTIKNSATFDTHNTSNEATATLLDNYHVGIYIADAFPLVLANSLFGGTIQNCKFFRGNAAVNGHICSINYCSSYSFSNCEFGVIQYARVISARSIYLLVALDCTFDNIYQFNSSFYAQSSARVLVTNLDHTDRLLGNTNATSGLCAAWTSTGCHTFKFDGITFGKKGTVAGYHNPYLGIFNIVGCNNVTLRNAGTKTAPLLCENTTNACAYIALDGGNNSNLKMQRMYLNITRTGAFETFNTSLNMLVESIHGSVGSVSVNGLNTIVRGIRSDAINTNGKTSVYGTHFLDMFESDTVGDIMFMMNEPNVATSSFASLTLAGSAGGFTSSGRASMPNLGDVLISEMSYFALGHTAFQNVAPTVRATNSGNFSYEYDIDKGPGFSGTFKTLDAANLFAETVNSATGFKLKLRITATTANASNDISSVLIKTDSTLSAQTNNLYPLETATIEIDNLRIGSRVQIYDLTNSIELYNEIAPATSIAYSAPFSSSFSVRVRVMYATAVTADKFIEFTSTITAEGLYQSVLPEIDQNYVINAINGFTVAGVAINDAALLIEAEDGTFTWAQIYAYETAWLTTEEGIRDEGRFITAIDPHNYLFDNFKIKNVSSPSLPLIITGGWGRDAVTGLSATLIDTTRGTIFSNPDLVIAYSMGGSGLSVDEQAKLANIDSISTKIDGLIENSAGNRFTAKALEAVPSGSTLTAAEVRTEMDANSTKLAMIPSIPSNPLLADDIRLLNLDSKISDIPTQTLLSNDIRLNNLDGKISDIPTNPLITSDIRLNNLDAKISDIPTNVLAGDDVRLSNLDAKISDVSANVWAESTSNNNTAGSFGNLVQKLLTLGKFLGLK